MTWRYVDQVPVVYVQPPGPVAGFVTRPCCTWEDGRGALVCVVVEHLYAEGAPVWHPAVARQIRRILMDRHDRDVQVVEWRYPLSQGEEIREQVWAEPPGREDRRIQWLVLDDDELALLPDFRRLWVPPEPLPQNLHNVETYLGK